VTTVVYSTEAPRGCGFRKPDKTGVGISLTAPAPGFPCARLPLPLHHCPVCSMGIAPSRGWTWIEPQQLFASAPACALEGMSRGKPAQGRQLCVECQACFAGRAMPAGRHGLLWIGEGFYPTPESFLTEARRMGISRKLSALPKGFKLGETVVYLAHRECTFYDAHGVRETQPGIFSIFQPAGVDLVIDDPDQVPERALKLAEQVGDGARIVKVIPQGPQTELSLQQATP